MSPFEGAGSSALPPISDAAYAGILLAVDPALIGIRVVGWSGPARDLWVRRVTGLRPKAAIRKMPVAISEDRLLGGLDLAATLAGGRAVYSAGILAESRSGFLILAMAERLSAANAAGLAAAIDGAAGISFIALDEGIGPDEAPPSALLDRLAFTVEIGPADSERWPAADAVAAASLALPRIDCSPAVSERLCALAALMGVGSVRAEIFALRAARAAAALRGACSIDEADIALAARLVLVPRATRMPGNAAPPLEAPEPPESETQAKSETSERPLEDRIDAAAAAVLPEKLLEALAAQLGPRRRGRGAGTAGNAAGAERGRPAGVRPGQLTGRTRLSVLDTLRAAAPWQRLRRAAMAPQRVQSRIIVRPQDFHIRRFKEQPRRIAIFAVDSSGSSAVNRLAEAKGAILLLLADCYVQRDEVALIAFRGLTADLLLPPTHALARARRALAALPGGGPTPLAAGINAALRLAIVARRGGKQPLLIILTDGGANIGQDGKPGRGAAGRDALAAATACSVQNLPALVVDTSPRRQKFVTQLAGAMAARYMPLPYADAARLSQAVQAAGGMHGRAAA